MGKYDDIINLERPKSNHPQMDLIKRSAQFAPFSALTGYEDEIKETGRMVSKKYELTDDEKEKINESLFIIKNNLKNKPEVNITYFIPDLYKNGGRYATKKCVIKSINEIKKEIILTDKQIIKIDDIKEITGDIFDSYDII